MNIELYLLRVFYRSTMYHQYNKYIKTTFLKNNSKELHRLFEAVKAFHERNPGVDISSTANLEAWYYACYPATNAKDADLLSPIFQRLSDIDPDAIIAEEVIKKHIERVTASELAICSIEVSEGKRDFSDIGTLYESMAVAGGVSSSDSKDEYVTDDLGELLNATTRIPGLRWRLDSLNKHLGSLRKGDFGFVFKRPETGGTTLLASEVTHFALQNIRPIFWFNNEEQGAKVKLRSYQAAFGVTLQELEQDAERYSREFRGILGGRIRIIDSAVLSRDSVDRILRSNPDVSLIVFDQLDKIKGFEDDRDDIRLKAIYQWSRELAKAYAPVIGICQAGASAEGKKYLEMDDVDGSKTGKQGEADWILGIGKSNQQGYESVRHFHLCKNKLTGDVDTIPERRHWSWDVILDSEIARYRDIR